MNSLPNSVKILHFGKFYPPFNGGMEIYLRDLSEQQAKTNQVIALVHNHDFNFLTSKTISQTIHGVDIIRQKTLKPILFTPIMLGANRAVTKLVNQDKVDIIHIAWPNPSALLLLFNKKALTIPWVIQWQSDMVTKHSSFLLKLAYKFFRPFEKKLLKQASKIIVSTKEYFKHSNALLNYKYKCEFIPLGLKPQSTTIHKHDKNWANTLWKDAKYKIYNIGRLTFYKNHQLLIKAAELLPEAQFIITGTGELEAKLKTMVHNKSLNNIIFTGGLSNEKSNALMSSCDAFCLPSNDRAESYGMVLLEAINFNKNILVSNLKGSGMKWITSQTNLGCTFDCDDATDLVGKIKNLEINNPSVGDNAKQKQFKIDYCAHKIDMIYQSIINHNS